MKAHAVSLMNHIRVYVSRDTEERTVKVRISSFMCKILIFQTAFLDQMRIEEDSMGDSKEQFTSAEDHHHKTTLHF